MLNKKEVKSIVKKRETPKILIQKFQGKGTRARINTAAEKHMFGSKYSK